MRKQRHLVLVTAYDGSQYSGWQIQNNAPSIQEELERALARLTKEAVRVNGCSRTDAGVHAKAHVSSFRSRTRIPLDKLPLALGTVLPPDIVVVEAREAREDFSPRFDARGKHYIYRIRNHPRPDPFERRYAYHEPRPLDLMAMQEAARHLKGRQDYKTFRAAGFESKTSVRTLFDCHVSRDGDIISISIRGDAFLYNMVRIVAGTLLYVGLGKLEAAELPAIIQSGDRTQAGKTLGPHGLVLNRVYYPNDVFLLDV